MSPTFTSLQRRIGALAAVAAAAVAAGAPAAEAAPGALDPSFGSGGIVLADPGSVTVEGLEVQPDGKVLALDSGFDPWLYQRVLRYLPDGTLDPSFGGDGVAEPLVAPGFWTRAFALQSDGKIVVTGYSAGEYVIARLMPDGTLDPSFDGEVNGNGILHTPLTPSFDMPSSVEIDKQGRIVVAGATGTDDVAVVRYLPDGKLDKSLASDGTLVDVTPAGEAVYALAVQDDGLLVAGEKGPDTFVARYTEQGAVDTAFGQLGRRVVDLGEGEMDRPSSLAVQSDGTIVVGVRVSGPTSNPLDELLALTPGGAPDASFAGGGSVQVGVDLNSVALAADDKIVVGGYGMLDDDNAIAVERRNADGTPDSSFGGGAPVLTRPPDIADCSVERVAVAPDGKIVVAGSGYSPQLQGDMLAIARYQVDPDPPSGAAGTEPAGGPAPSGGTPPPLAPLALSGVKLTRSAFAVGSRGTAFVFKLNRAATVTIRIKRLRSTAKAVRLKRASAAGGNRVRFSGRVGRRALRPGRYRATLTAVDRAGNRSGARSVTFRVVRR